MTLLFAWLPAAVILHLMWLAAPVQPSARVASPV
jgi:hypothetical protein